MLRKVRGGRARRDETGLKCKGCSMNKMIGVMIDAEEMTCGLDCPWLDVFGVKPGSDDPQPRCVLCDRFLNEEGGGILRCSDCIGMETSMRSYARKMALNSAVQNKPNGIRLLEATKYKIDITSFESVTELFRYLVERGHAEPSLVMELTGLTKDEFDKVTEGRAYPYLVRKIQETIGVPAPKHITADEEMAMSSKLIHWSDK